MRAVTAMGRPSVLAEGSMVIAAHAMHAAANAACMCAGDMGLAEYALLASALERRAGLPLKPLRPFSGEGGDLPHGVRLLQENELVERVRDQADRRGFALRATLKGRRRAEQVDEAIAAALIDASCRLTEDALGHLVVRLREFSEARCPDQSMSALFPGDVLHALCAYRRAVERESAFSGMSSLQTAALLMLDESGEALPCDRLARRLGAIDGVMALQLRRLEERRMIQGDGLFELTEEGRGRVDDFSQRLGLRLEDAIVGVSPEEKDMLEGLCERCIYLFT